MSLSSGAAVAVGLFVIGGLFSVPGSGKVVEDSRTVAGFRSVDLEGPMAVEIRVAPEQRVAVITDDNLVAHVRTRVVDGVLRVETQGDVRPSKGVRLVVEGPQLEAIEAT